MQFSTSVIPTLPSLSLSAEDQALLSELSRLSLTAKRDMLLSEAYYLGEQVIKNLRIAVPAELEFLRTIVGWAAMAVDPYVSRLSVDCIRLPNATDGDQHLSDMLSANGFEFEQTLAFQDALTLGRGIWTVGSPVEKGGAPLITVESPLTTTVLYDLRGLTPRAMLNQFFTEGRQRATFMAPGRTIHLAVDDGGQWVIADRDDHDFDFVPVVRMAHGARTTNREGRSAITLALRSAIDGACRTLLGLEVARELYSVPQKVILGAAEDAFVKKDGTEASAWETYIHKTLGLERDENGELPEIHQFAPYDPSVFTKILDWYASNASGIVLSPPQDMGLYTQGNPPSADGAVAANAERDLRAINLQKQFGHPLVKVVQYAARFENGGVLPEQYKNLALDWNPVTLPNPGVTSDAITKQITAGAVPPTSDVVLKRLGYSDVERQRLVQDRAEYEKKVAREQARTASRTIAESLTKPPTQTPASGSPAAGL